jgi:hypothetical protein
VIGGILIAAGLPILLDSFARFALQGLGTPAPVMPPKHLVVTGFYRYVRNLTSVVAAELTRWTSSRFLSSSTCPCSSTVKRPQD